MSRETKDSSLQPSLIVLSGMSGSGKNTALRAFEDLGYFCVDNLPTGLIGRLLEMASASQGRIDKLAIVVDIRLRETTGEFERLIHQLRSQARVFSLVFLDASDEALARRYSETRRTHPLARNSSLLEGLRIERRKLVGLRSLADHVVDTSDFSVHDLRQLIYGKFREAEQDGLSITLVSFGYKHGLPFNADLAFDVRYLPNPYFQPGLRELTGNDPEVVEFLQRCPDTQEILSRLEDLLTYLLPRYSREGKSYLTVAIGCTGGRHRSVALSNQLESRLDQLGYRVKAIHRDVRRK